MRLSCDQEADVLSLWLKDAKLKTSKEIAPGIVLHYDYEGQVASIAVIAVSRFLGGRKLQDLELDLTPDRQIMEYEAELPKQKDRQAG